MRGFTSGNPAPECFSMATVETQLCNEEECPCAPPETPCVLFFDTANGNLENNLGKCPAELNPDASTKTDRCAFRGNTGVLEHSCCSSSFVTDVLFEQADFKGFEASVETMVTSETCKPRPLFFCRTRIMNISQLLM